MHDVGEICHVWHRDSDLVAFGGSMLCNLHMVSMGRSDPVSVPYEVVMQIPILRGRLLLAVPVCGNIVSLFRIYHRINVLVCSLLVVQKL